VTLSFWHLRFPISDRQKDARSHRHFRVVCAIDCVPVNTVERFPSFKDAGDIRGDTTRDASIRDISNARNMGGCDNIETPKERRAGTERLLLEHVQRSAPITQAVTKCGACCLILKENLEKGGQHSGRPPTLASAGKGGKPAQRQDGSCLILRQWRKSLPVLKFFRLAFRPAVNDAVVYLTEARKVTGEILHVDGGAHATRGSQDSDEENSAHIVRRVQLFPRGQPADCTGCKGHFADVKTVARYFG
jgi:hypothetical protein